MKNKLILAVGATLIFASACHKTSESTPNPGAVDFNTFSKTVLTDFTSKVAVSGYKDLDQASVDLYNSLATLNSSTTEANLVAARTAWKDMRIVWEQCEGFLFGPVEDNNYGPDMDTSPTSYMQIDSLLNSSNPLEVTDIKDATLSLRGFHPIEYIIFGDHSDRTAASLTPRQKKYMISLATDLKNTCHALYQSWNEKPIDFANEVNNAGSGNGKYKKKQEAYTAIVKAMIAICEEVGEGKMKKPFDAKDPAIVESPYSGNSTTDFKNNIIGLQNVYLCRYKQDGYGIDELVNFRNKSLDVKIQAQLTAAINSFDNINLPYEEAIIDQRAQVKATMDALGTLKNTLETELKPFVVQYITD